MSEDQGRAQARAVRRKAPERGGAGARRLERLDGVRPSGAGSAYRMVGNELQERAVGVAEIDDRARAPCAEAPQRPRLDADAAALEVTDGIGNRAVPLEAQIAVARCYRKPRHLGGVKGRSMQVELRGAETIGPALRTSNELGAQHIAVERVRALPVGHMHDAVVEGDG